MTEIALLASRILILGATTVLLLTLAGSALWAWLNLDTRGEIRK